MCSKGGRWIGNGRTSRHAHHEVRVQVELLSRPTRRRRVRFRFSRSARPTISAAATLRRFAISSTGSRNLASAWSRCCRSTRPAATTAPTTPSARWRWISRRFTSSRRRRSICCRRPTRRSCAETDRSRLRGGNVDYATVKALKWRLLASAFDEFERRHLGRRTVRGRNFRDFTKSQAWLDGYTLFRALMAHNNGAENFDDWPEEQRTSAAARAWMKGLGPDERAAFDRRRNFYAYVQWIAVEAVDDCEDACGIARCGADGRHSLWHQLLQRGLLRASRVVRAGLVRRGAAGDHLQGRYFRATLGPELGHPGLRLDRHGSRRFPLVAPARGRTARSLPQLPRRSHPWLLPALFVSVAAAAQCRIPAAHARRGGRAHGRTAAGIPAAR